MRYMDFKMEREGLLSRGDAVHVTEGTLPVAVYYTIDPSLAMSGNIPFRDKLKVRDGIVESVEENARGYYVRVAFDE